MDWGGFILFLLLVWFCLIAYAIGKQDGNLTEQLKRDKTKIKRNGL